MSETEFAKLKVIFPSAELWMEGGQAFAYLPKLRFSSGGLEYEMKALLCPHAREGYLSRLFLERPIPGKGQNWNVFSIFGTSWHACSWNGIAADKAWAEILAGHLMVLR